MMKRKAPVAVILATAPGLSISSSAHRVRTNRRKATGRCFLRAGPPPRRTPKLPSCRRVDRPGESVPKEVTS